MYSTSIFALTEANELETPNLVVGQALVIPIIGEYYFVQPGDSLFSISEMMQISVEQLARVNNIQIGQVLPVGLRLYIPPKMKEDITTFDRSEERRVG